MPLNHPARDLDAYVDGLDLSALEAVYLGVGSKPYRPDLMLKIVLWEMLDGRSSPAQWHRDVRYNIVLAWLGQGIRPSRTTMFSFRDRTADVIVDLHAGAVRQGIAEGLLHPTEGVLDGTTMRACASRHRTINLTVLDRRRQELAAAIAEDEAARPVVNAPRWMAQTAGGRLEQSRRYEAAHEQLQRRLQENARRPAGKRLPEKKVTVSTSDPPAALGRDKENVFCPLYTTQFVVDPDSLVVLSFEVFASATDAGTLGPMLDRTAWAIQQSLDAITTDSGYCSLLDIQQAIERGVELYAPLQENDFTEKKQAAKTDVKIGRNEFIWKPEEGTYTCPMGHTLDYKGKERKRRRNDEYVFEQRFHCPAEHCRDCPLRQRCVKDPERGRTVKRLEGQELLDAHAAKMKTPIGKAKRKRRGQVIERAFADVKQHRQVRRLHGRGIRRARAEIGLVVLAQTAQTIIRLRKEHTNAEKIST